MIGVSHILLTLDQVSEGRIDHDAHRWVVVGTARNEDSKRLDTGWYDGPKRGVPWEFKATAGDTRMGNRATSRSTRSTTIGFSSRAVDTGSPCTGFVSGATDPQDGDCAGVEATDCTVAWGWESSGNSTGEALDWRDVLIAS